MAKGRLLHYFPMNAQGGGGTEQQDKQGKKEEDDVSTWCGWHNDHGSLTGLTPAMYLDEAGHEVDPGQLQQAAVGSGLFVLSRSGELVQVVGVPADDLIFQIGETAEIHSGGVLQATPHAVKGGWVAVSGVGGSTSMDPGDWLHACMHAWSPCRLGSNGLTDLLYPTTCLLLLMTQGTHARCHPGDLCRLHGARVVSDFAQTACLQIAGLVFDWGTR